ncbi:coordinator of PRMT5 and differentiation stimulator isoform 2-T2 [Liasis olivaceus]
METAGQDAPPGRSLACRMKVNGSTTIGQEEVEVKRAKSFIWSPGKETVVAKISTPEDSDDFEDFPSENEDWELIGEDCSMPTLTVFPEMKPVSLYEEEDWDKELADSENNKNPYGRKGRLWERISLRPQGAFSDHEASCVPMEAAEDRYVTDRNNTSSISFKK